jgi:hypothetical protein
MLIWISVYIAERIFQMQFVKRMYLEDVLIESSKSPPDLQYLVIIAVAINIVLTALLILVLFLFANYVTSTEKTGTFVNVVSTTLVQLIVYDYTLSVLLSATVGIMVASSVQRNRSLRYRDVGVRAIRAFAEMFMFIFMIVSAVPYYRMLFRAVLSDPSNRFMGVQV